jgi:hypothetical protein
MIDSALMGRVVYGYFLTACPICFVIDIDDHTKKGEGYLLSVYDRMKKRFFDFPPSVLYRSPNGLHAYYFLAYPMPFEILHERLKEILKDLPVEIKPTTRIGLRIPQVRNFINPETFLPVYEDFETLFDTAVRYYPPELLTDIAPAEIRETLKERKSKILKTRSLQKIANFENKFSYIENGTTNDALCQLVPIYRSSGLTADETAQRFYALLAPAYSGELKNYRRLLQRVKSFYRSIPAEPIIKNTAQLDFFSEMLSNKISDRYTEEVKNGNQARALKQKKEKIKTAVLRIENWKMYLDGIYINREKREYWNYLYPFFSKNMKEGFYPIPRNLWRQLHGNYNEWLLPFLIDVGYLERSPYGYSAGYGTCYHYKIKQDVF